MVQTRWKETENRKIIHEHNVNCICYANGIIHHEFVLEKLTLNGRFYNKVFMRLIAPVHCVWPKFQESGSWYLLHNNAPGVFSVLLAKRGISVSSHPPYSHDFKLADIILFPKSETVMKGTRFEAITLIQIFLTFCVFMASVQELNCHTVYCQLLFVTTRLFTYIKTYKRRLTK
jgi:hypothetical protein